MKCRGEGREILEDVPALVDAPRLQIILAKFKSRTSTGLVDVRLQDLKEATVYVLEDLSHIFKQIIRSVLGPAHDNEVCLHLLRKKLSGFRTVATFSSIWRLLMGALSGKLRDWDS